MAKKGEVRGQTTRDADLRPVRLRRYPHLFLIVCEDQKTEPYYFEALKRDIPEETIYLITIGTGRDSLGVVGEVIKERERIYTQTSRMIDETWAVFDVDDSGRIPGKMIRFNEALEAAKREKIRVAYSNEVFELWVLLHFESVAADLSLGRKEVYERLEAAIRSFAGHDQFIYSHGSTEVIEIMLNSGFESDAMRRAEEILNFHMNRASTPLKANPSTTIHILVKRLRDLIAYYSS